MSTIFVIVILLILIIIVCFILKNNFIYDFLTKESNCIKVFGSNMCGSNYLNVQGEQIKCPDTQQCYKSGRKFPHKNQEPIKNGTCEYLCKCEFEQWPGQLIGGEKEKQTCKTQYDETDKCREWTGSDDYNCLNSDGSDICRPGSGSKKDEECTCIKAKCENTCPDGMECNYRPYYGVQALCELKKENETCRKTHITNIKTEGCDYTGYECRP